MNRSLVTVSGVAGAAGARGAASVGASQGYAPAIEISALTKTFRTRAGVVRAVDGIDLRIQRGEVVALLGHNGAGKTTTLDMVLGFTSPTSGSVQVFGTDPGRAVRAGLVGGMLQTDALLTDLTVANTLAMVATQHINPISVEAALERAGATAIAKRRVSACSGGEQQRLRFALALLADPDLLVLDEPTAGMDVAARREFWATMHAEADAGRTIVFATHYLAEAEEFAERTVVMRQGRIVADGTTDEVRALGGTRTVSCAWDDRDGDPAHLPGVAGAERVNGRVVLHLAARVTGGPDGAISAHGDAPPDALARETDGSADVNARGEGSPSDVLARYLLTRTRARDVLIQEASLEDAFIGLSTHDDPTTTETTDAGSHR